jgi:CRP-like cAMP-binding protein
MATKTNPLMKYINEISFFDGFSDKDKNRLVQTVGIIKKYDKRGYTIFNDGGKGASMFVILEGVINIVRANIQGDREKRVILAKLKKGSVFGEISLLSNQRRTTGAITESSLVIVMEINKETLEGFDLSMRELFHKEMISILIRRLDDMNKRFINKRD